MLVTVLSGTCLQPDAAAVAPAGVVEYEVAVGSLFHEDPLLAVIFAKVVVRSRGGSERVKVERVALAVVDMVVVDESVRRCEEPDAPAHRLRGAVRRTPAYTSQPAISECGL